MSVDCGDRVRGGRARRRGSSRTAQPDLAIVTTADRRAVPAAGRVHPEPRDRGTGAGQPGAPAERARRRGRAQLGQRERGDRRAGSRRRRAGWPRSPAPASAVPASDVLVCSTGLIGYFMPMDALESGIPQLTASLNGADAAADAILTTDTVRKEAVATVAGTNGGRRWDGQGRGDARARRWPRCSRSSRPMPRSTVLRCTPR